MVRIGFRPSIVGSPPFGISACRATTRDSGGGDDGGGLLSAAGWQAELQPLRRPVPGEAKPWSLGATREPRGFESVQVGCIWAVFFVFFFVFFFFVIFFFFFVVVVVVFLLGCCKKEVGECGWMEGVCGKSRGEDAIR